MKCVRLVKIAAMDTYVHLRASAVGKCKGDVNSGGVVLIL